MNCKNVSKNSWTFEAGLSGDLLVKEVFRLTRGFNCDLAVVLGSGWDEVSRLGKFLGCFNYLDWDCFPVGQISGHSGRMFVAEYTGWKILFFAGRFHCYQGFNAFQAAFPVRLASALGCPRILLTCATGGINQTYRPGDFMLVEDHLNLMGDNPLRGLDDSFIDMTSVYLRELYDKLLSRDILGMNIHRGVLAALPGPSYETPAEIRCLSTFGADVVAMSTVHEAIMARYLGMQVAAASFVANYAAGLSPSALSHQDVLACGTQHAHLFSHLVHHIITAWQDMNVAMSG
jgi:purine-nucleoside phosphorylase